MLYSDPIQIPSLMNFKPGLELLSCRNAQMNKMWFLPPKKFHSSEKQNTGEQEIPRDAGMC